MAAVARITDRNFNRTIDTFPSGRSFLFFKEFFADEQSGKDFIVVCEIDDTSTLIADPEAPLIDADWDEWVRIQQDADFTFEGFFTPAQRRDFNLIMWWTWVQRRRVGQMIADLVTDGATIAQRRNSFTGAMVTGGVPLLTAQGLAPGITGRPSVNAINYTQLGLTDVPNFFRPFLRAVSDT